MHWAVQTSMQVITMCWARRGRKQARRTSEEMEEVIGEGSEAVMQFKQGGEHLLQLRHLSSLCILAQVFDTHEFELVAEGEDGIGREPEEKHNHVADVGHDRET